MKRKLFYVLVLVLVLPSFSGCSGKAKREKFLTRAEDDFAAGNYEAAKINYMRVIQFDPNNPTPFQRLGAIWLEEGDPLYAGAFLKRAQDLAPNDVANNMRMAKVFLAIGQIDDARKLVLAALKSGADGDAFILAAETARTPEQVRETEQLLKNASAKNTAAYQIALANLAGRKEDLAGAQAAVKRALEVEPKSPEAHQAAAILALLEKKSDVALNEFKTAASLAPPRSPAQLAYARELQKAQGSEAADKFLADLTKKVPDFLTAWTARAQIAMSGRKYDEALKHLDNVISRDPRNVEATLMRSECLLAKRQPQKAIDELERLNGTFPGLPPVKLWMAKAYLQQDKPAQAAAALDEAIKKKPDYADAIMLRAQLHLRSREFEPAIDELKALAKNQPKLTGALLLLADAYRGAGKFDDAENIIREQIKENPKASRLYSLLGIVQEQAKKPEEARQSYEKVLEIEPQDLLALNQLVSLDVKAKDFASAHKQVQERLQKQPDSAPLHIFEGKILMAEGKWKEAETTLKKAIELNSNLPAAYDLLVSVYLATNRLPEAAREVESVLTKAPKNLGALMTLARIREKQNDFSGAAANYKKLLAIKDDFVPALNNLAYLDAEYLNQPDEALDLAQKARHLAPEDASVGDTLGWAYYKNGNYQQALPVLQESATKLATNPEAQFHLGMTEYMMGNTEAARTAFEHVVGAPEDSPVKSAAEKRLKLLGTASASNQKPSLDELEKMVAEEPKDVVARLWLADGYEQKSEFAKSAAAYEAALNINPKLTQAALSLAQLYSGPLADKQKALTYAKQARALTPNDAKTGALLGRIAFAAGDTTWAYDLLQESARQLPLDAQVAHDLAWATYGLGKLDEARREMQRALRFQPEPAVAQDAEAFLTFTALNDNEAALAQARPQIEAKLQSDPNYVPALIAAAALDVQDEKNEEAIKRLQQVLQRFPDSALAQRDLAALYLQDPARRAEAYNLASNARKILPEDAKTGEVLGECAYEQRDYARAAQLLEESSRKSPLDASGRFYLGLTYKQQKRSAAAIRELNAALSAGLSTERSKQAQQALIELRTEATE